MDKLKMHSPDRVAGNIERLAELFPGCVTESRDEDGELKRAIDFDLLRQELSDQLVEGPQERYRLDWPGKREALLAANAPIAKTLRPCREESVDFDSTRNLFIEGDNLEALKLLQETYLSKVKMIYIDPPYNTGLDLLYEDDYCIDRDEYLLRSGQERAAEGKLVANTEANGRFHSDWLSMMYSRLRVARNLLRDDGVIFISIDDNESSSLRKICDEVFGEDKFIGTFKWNKTSKAPTLSKRIREKFEYVLCYMKSDVRYLRGPDSYNEMAPLFNSGNGVTKLRFPAGSVEFLFDDGNYGAGKYGEGDKQVVLHDAVMVKGGKNREPFEMSARFKWAQDTLLARISAGQRLAFKTPKFTTMYYYLSSEDGKFIAPSDLLSQSECDVLRNDEGYSEMRRMFGGVSVFEYVKPVSLPKYLVRMADDPEAVYLDFFAGSSTTAHAVMKLNAEDGGARRFIMIQLPEECEQGSPAAREGFRTIAEVSKERIRRAGEIVRAEHTGSSTIDRLDTGFRVLKTDTSNMAEVYYRPEELKQDDLLDQVDNIRPGRGAEDLLFQVLLDWGVDLALPIAREDIDGREVFFVDGNALAACFVADGSVDEALVKQIAQRQPIRVVFRDAGFASDNARINVEQIFKALSPSTEVRTL